MILKLRITLTEGDDHVNPVKSCSVPREQKVQRSLGRENLVYFRNRKKACMDGKKEKEVKEVGVGHSIRDFKCQSSASIVNEVGSTMKYFYFLLIKITCLLHEKQIYGNPGRSRNCK